MSEHNWFTNYPEGVPHEIDPDKYSSLIELIDQSVSKFGDATAYENMGKELSFRELDSLSNDFAAYLQNDLKLKKGDRIAIQMPNLLQYPVVMFGALKAGAVVVNTNPLYTAPEMEHQFQDAGIKVIVILANFADKLEKILPETQIEHVIITEIGDLMGGIKGFIVNLVVRHIKKMVPSYRLPKAIPLKSALKTGKRKTLTKPEIKGEDIAYLQYTGGTTGVSKGAILTHRNIVANMEQISAWMIPVLKERREIVITALPLYHIFALTVNCLSMLKIGARNLLVTNPRDMKAFIKDLKRYRFSVITGVNTLFNGLLNQEDFKSVDFSNLRCAVAGGMAVQKQVATKWEEVTGKPIIEGYGLTETSPVLTCNPTDGNTIIGTIGMPLPSTDIVIMDDDGNILPIGERGELVTKGPQVMPGYWEKLEETKNTFIKGWFKTGDIAVQESNGYFRIVDRKKEMILVSGFNVYPNEIEDVVSAHPKVLEVGAIGIPDERSTEAVMICVVKKDPSLTEAELLAYCRENLTGYKIPKVIEFREDLPKSNVGKILRRLLREEYVSD